VKHGEVSVLELYQETAKPERGECGEVKEPLLIIESVKEPNGTTVTDERNAAYPTPQQIERGKKNAGLKKSGSSGKGVLSQE